MEQVSERYATALFELAKEENKTDTWQEQMRSVKEVFTDNKEFLKVLGQYRITQDEKKDMLTKIFKSSLDKDLMNFMLLLVDKKRIGNIVNISSAFNTMCNDAKGVKEGVVYSVKKLSAADKKEIETAVGTKLNANVDLINKLDPTLISGVKVIVDNYVLDGSMKNKMNSLRSELMKGK